MGRLAVSKKKFLKFKAGDEIWDPPTKKTEKNKKTLNVKKRKKTIKTRDWFGSHPPIRICVFLGRTCKIAWKIMAFQRHPPPHRNAIPPPQKKMRFLKKVSKI